MGALYKTIEGFLDEEARSRLLDYACASQASFKPTMVTDVQGNHVDETYRISSKLKELGGFAALIEQRALALAPQLIADLGLTPFQPTGTETEIVAHGDGAFYKWHIDTFVGRDRGVQAYDRMITLVYYFFREPRAFSGGALRLHPLGVPGGDGQGGVVDIQPEQGTLVAFPSWLPHEVLRVVCPSGDFADSRFAINCWLKRDRHVVET